MKHELWSLGVVGWPAAAASSRVACGWPPCRAAAAASWWLRRRIQAALRGRICGRGGLCARARHYLLYGQSLLLVAELSLAVRPSGPQASGCWRCCTREEGPHRRRPRSSSSRQQAAGSSQAARQQPAVSAQSEVRSDQRSDQRSSEESSEWAIVETSVNPGPGIGRISAPSRSREPQRNRLLGLGAESALADALGCLGVLLFWYRYCAAVRCAALLKTRSAELRPSRAAELLLLALQPPPAPCCSSRGALPPAAERGHGRRGGGFGGGQGGAPGQDGGGG
jgi:hypothetical protein